MALAPLVGVAGCSGFCPDVLLVPVEPAGQGDYQQMKWLYDVAHCPNRLSVVE